MSRSISKSKYLAGLQCPKLLWSHYHAKEAIPGPDAATQAVFDQGHEVGRLAQTLFPGGTEVEWSEDGAAMRATTEKLLAERRPLYEATFGAAGVFARADILNPVEDGHWDIIEVKSGTSVKEINLHDVALQRYCYESAGIPIRRCHLMHINNQYVRLGALDPHGLLHAEDITAAIAPLIPDVPVRIQAMQQMLAQPVCPAVEIGEHCDAPYPCPLKAECWATRWASEAAATPTGTWTWDASAIGAFLDDLTYPLYLLDFETMGTAIPLFDESRPYQQVPFQFSLHVVERLEEEPRHISWLWDGTGDPRQAMFTELRRAIGNTGSVLAYYKRFEEARLQESAAALPEHAAWVDALMPRMVDPGDPFRLRAARHPALGERRWSLKLVLPLLTDLSYDALEIQDGCSASAEFLRVLDAKTDPAERAVVRKNLEEYCRQDTYGMLAILRKLDSMR
jgi:hypothetical protein